MNEGRGRGEGKGRVKGRKEGREERKKKERKDFKIANCFFDVHLINTEETDSCLPVPFIPFFFKNESPKF